MFLIFVIVGCISAYVRNARTYARTCAHTHTHARTHRLRLARTHAYLISVSFTPGTKSISKLSVGKHEAPLICGHASLCSVNGSSWLGEELSEGPKTKCKLQSSLAFCDITGTSRKKSMLASLPVCPSLSLYGPVAYHYRLLVCWARKTDTDYIATSVGRLPFSI